MELSDNKLIRWGFMTFILLIYPIERLILQRRKLTKIQRAFKLISRLNRR